MESCLLCIIFDIFCPLALYDPYTLTPETSLGPLLEGV